MWRGSSGASRLVRSTPTALEVTCARLNLMVVVTATNCRPELAGLPIESLLLEAAGPAHVIHVALPAHLRRGSNPFCPSTVADTPTCTPTSFVATAAGARGDGWSGRQEHRERRKGHRSAGRDPCSKAVRPGSWRLPIEVLRARHGRWIHVEDSSQGHPGMLWRLTRIPGDAPTALDPAAARSPRACLVRNGTDGKCAILRMSRTGIEPVTRCLKGSCSTD
jgi:hypothetical protein